MKTSPLLPLLLPVLAGILLAGVVSPLPRAGVVTLLLMLLGLLSWLVARHRTGVRLVLSLLFLTAFLFRTQLQVHNYAHSLPLGKQQMQVRLLDSPRANTYGYKANALVQQVLSHEGWVPAHSKIVLRIADSAVANVLCRGDRLEVSARVMLPRQPKAADTFNYPQYLRRRNIYYVAYCPITTRPDDPPTLLLSHPSPIHGLLMMQRRWCRHLEDRSMESQSVALAQALLLGNRDHLSDTTQVRFRTAGIAHLLSLSGLHVGLFAALLSFVCRPLGRRRWSRTAILVLQLSALVLYLLLTGDAPSTRRATLMFAFLMVGQHMHTPPPLANTLAGAAFLMLFVNPSLIYDVGFQLSYTAMLAIIMIYIPLWRNLKDSYPSLQPSNGDPIWHRISVYIIQTALFATLIQLSTMPLTLYHFHSFPTYFLVANMILTPLLPVLMMGALASLCFGAIPGLGPVVVALYSFMARGVDWITSAVAALPHALLEPVFFPLPAALLTMVLLVGWAVVLNKKIISDDLWDDGCVNQLIYKNKLI